MSLPQFDVQGSLFESLGAIAPELFSDNDKYKIFAQKVWPVLAQSREQLLECYQADNGRPGVEPVMLLGVMIFQFLERVLCRVTVFRGNGAGSGAHYFVGTGAWGTG